MARRDLRSGQQTAQAMLDPQGVRLSITWGEPKAGMDLPQKIMRHCIDIVLLACPVLSALGCSLCHTMLPQLIG